MAHLWRPEDNLGESVSCILACRDGVWVFKLRLQVFLSKPSISLAFPASLRTGTKETAPPGTGCVAVELSKSIAANTHRPGFVFSGCQAGAAGTPALGELKESI